MADTQAQQAPRRQQTNRRAPAMAEEKQFDERTLHIDRVARVVKGGRRFRFRALVVVGDRKHKVGVGLAKGADVTSAVSKATDVAKKNMVRITLYKDTLPHEAEATVAGAHILLKPASAGTGLIAGGVVRTILEVAGVHNALSKSLGSSNKANIAYATMDALQSLVPADKWVTAGARAKSPKTTKQSSKATKSASPKSPNKPADKKAVKGEK